MDCGHTANVFQGGIPSIGKTLFVCVRPSAAYFFIIRLFLVFRDGIWC